MKLWSKKYISCQSCNTKNWKHKANGYCVKCYDLLDRKNILNNWDINNIESIVPIKGISILNLEVIKNMNSLEISTIRNKIIDQIDRRIFLYREYNNPSSLDAISIEYYLSKVYSIVKDIPKVYGGGFHGVAIKYNDNFNSDQRKIIIKHLIYILMSRKFKLDWYEIFNK